MWFSVESNVVGGEWEADIRMIDDGNIDGSVTTLGIGFAATAPHAICLAALKAVGALPAPKETA